MKARRGAGRPRPTGPPLTLHPQEQLPEAPSLLSHLPRRLSAGPRAPHCLQGRHSPAGLATGPARPAAGGQAAA